MVPGTADTSAKDRTVFGGYIYYESDFDGMLYRTDGIHSTQVGGADNVYVNITGTDQNYLYFTLTQVDGTGSIETFWRTNESGTIPNP